MSIIHELLFIYFTIALSYDIVKKIKLKDFEEENEQLEKEGIKVGNYNCEEMRLNKGIFSDNYLILFFSILLSLAFIFIKKDLSMTVLFSPVIPILCSLFFIDLRMKQLPNELVYLIGIIGLINVAFSAEQPIDNLKTALMLFIIYFIIAIVTGGAIGGGDVKLIGCLGLFFNTNLFVNILIYPFLLGAIQGCYFIFIKKEKKDFKFSFGPAIILSALFLQFIC